MDQEYHRERVLGVRLGFHLASGQGADPEAVCGPKAPLRMAC